MLDGAKAQCNLSTDEDAWSEVINRLQRLRRIHEHTIYKPVAA
jgi:hypothetical protein